MKFTIHRLRVGDLVWAQVVENLPGSELIVSFQGDLTRVSNHTNLKFSGGDKILVRVSATEPLAFQIVNEDGPRRGATRLDVSA